MVSALESRVGKLHFAAMQIEDMDEVIAIENAVYSHPWTRGNFLDALHSGYQALTIRDRTRRLLAYFLAMQVVDEAHLLNISVLRELHGVGLGHLSLELAVEWARKHSLRMMLLEVRSTNARALYVYQRYGFVEIGCRKNYYPVAPSMREDAIIMSLSL